MTVTISHPTVIPVPLLRVSTTVTGGARIQFKARTSAEIPMSKNSSATVVKCRFFAGVGVPGPSGPWIRHRDRNKAVPAERWWEGAAAGGGQIDLRVGCEQSDPQLKRSGEHESLQIRIQNGARSDGTSHPCAINAANR